MENISIIVPVYNVEKYLRKSIESLINQTYKNLEIILVDDGSTDNSGKICDEYAKKDNRIKVIHKVNEGLAMARNTGIENANGTFIGFIDSDDYIENNMYERLLKDAKNYNAELVMCRLLDCYGTVGKKDNNEEIRKINREEAIKIIMEAEITSVTVVNKLYKKSLFDDLRFITNSTAEDAYIMLDILMKCDNIVLDMAQLYYYIHRENSITTGKFNYQTGYGPIKAYEKNYKLIEQNFPQLLPVAQMRLIWANFIVLDRMISTNSKIDKEIVKYLRKNLKNILKDKTLTRSRKISAILLKININLYRICVSVFKNRKRKLFENV